MRPLSRQTFASSGMLLLLLPLLGLSAQANMLSAGAMARATGGGHAGASATAIASSQRRAPPAYFQAPEQRAQSLAAAGATRRQRQLRALSARLNRLESAPTMGPEDCQRWSEMNERYIGLAGNERKMRRNELVWAKECAAQRAAAESRLRNFRQALFDESNELEMASNLVGDYVELRLASAASPALARQFERMRAEDAQFGYALDRLDSFLKYLESKLDELAQVGHTQAQPVAELGARDEAEQLERSMRKLIDREPELSDDDSNQLLELADSLERVLADPSAVQPHSGRWRYLFGALEAARGLVLRRLRGDSEPAAAAAAQDELQQQQQQYFEEPQEAAALAELEEAQAPQAQVQAAARAQVGAVVQPQQMLAHHHAPPAHHHQDQLQQQQQPAAPRPQPSRMGAAVASAMSSLGGAGQAASASSLASAHHHHQAVDPFAGRRRRFADFQAAAAAAASV